MKKDNSMNPKPRSKKKYKKPSVRSEEIMTFGALCNGMASGGRKATVVPDGCNASKLLS